MKNQLIVCEGYIPRPLAAVGTYLAAGILLWFLAGPPFSGAMDSPAPDGVVTANFGLNEQGRPSLGVVFRAEGPVHAADRGELVFHRGQEDRSSRLPSPLGAWAAYDHGDGILGIYSRFEDAPAFSPAPAPRNPRPERGETLAASGVSGWSEQTGFSFALYDRRERRWVNPSLIIAPFPDDRAPEILSVRLQSSDGTLIPPGQTRISQGRYGIIVHAVDALSRASAIRLAPYRLGVSLNGAEAGSLNFETFSARDGILSIRRNGLSPVSEVYAPYPAFKVGEAWFTRGQTTLELIARDASGNEASFIMRLEVD
ncbi:MAG: hypothetical protein LBQ46_00605 [Treponema sp.]|jgi:hypothetical protein|nr:hypothetical protein [Treponema sp.]